tara:strand:- start:72 stop:548 length:477 start_codon:yes stop_codon:yes gene_type:complete
MQVRWLIRKDIEKLMVKFPNVDEERWDYFVECLGQRNIIGMVLEWRGYLYGFVIYELQKDRIELIDIVAEEKDFVAILVDTIKSKLGNIESRRKIITLEISEYDVSSQLLFQELEFRCVTIKKDYYIFEYSKDANIALDDLGDKELEKLATKAKKTPR